MRANKPLTIGLSTAAIVVALGIIWYTYSSTHYGPPPPMASGMTLGAGKTMVPAGMNKNANLSTAPGATLPHP